MHTLTHLAADGTAVVFVLGSTVLLALAHTAVRRAGRWQAFRCTGRISMVRRGEPAAVAADRDDETRIELLVETTRNVDPPAQVYGLSTRTPRLESSAHPAGDPGARTSHLPRYRLRDDVTGTMLVVEQAALVGTADVCSLRLKEPTVSREHATLHSTPHGLLVRDLDSTNGTLLDGEPVDPARSMVARPGQRIAFGAACFELLDGQPRS